MQVQSLRQRLSDLKKASIQLKSKVLQESRIESLNVSQILTTVYPNASNARLSVPMSQINTLLDMPVSRSKHPNASSSNSLSYSPNSSVFVPPNPSPRNQDHILWNSNSSSHESSPNREAIELEIERLRLQNDEIQSKIMNLSAQISDLRVVETMRQEEGWKEHLPFINKQATIGIFLTKLHIKDYDFDKIDYEPTHCELLYDRLTLAPQHRPERTLRLASIGEVRYLGDRRMRMEMKEEEMVFLYMEFSNQEERQAWDLALVINHKIVVDKDLNKNLFVEEKEMKVSLAKSRSSVKISNDYEDRTSELKISDKEVNKRKGSVRFNDKKLERFTNAQKSSHSSSLKRSEVSLERNQLQYTLNGTTLHTPQVNTPEPNLINSSGITSSNREKSLKDLLVFGEVGESHHQSRANTSKFNAPQVNFQNLEFYPTFTQQIPPTSPFPSPSSSPEPPKQLSEWQKLLMQLKEGYFFTKYAKNGFKPHNKKIFISSEQQMLICANNENLNERKAIRIQNITAVKYPAIGQGIRKYIKNAKVENFCVIEYHHQGKDQVIELGCIKVNFIKRFSEQLREFLRRKGLLIND